MSLWVEDFKYDLAMALRAVGIGMAAVAWASALGSEGQLGTDPRAYAEVGAAILAVCVVQFLTALPPSVTVVDLLRPLEKDIQAAARERSGGDAERLRMLIARIAALAAVRIRRGSGIPRDRRAWFRALARLAGGD